MNGAVRSRAFVLGSMVEKAFVSSWLKYQHASYRHSPTWVHYRGLGITAVQFLEQTTGFSVATESPGENK
jgi:hypothetical protein